MLIFRCSKFLSYQDPKFQEACISRDLMCLQPAVRVLDMSRQPPIGRLYLQDLVGPKGPTYISFPRRRHYSKKFMVMQEQSDGLLPDMAPLSTSANQHMTLSKEAPSSLKLLWPGVTAYMVSSPLPHMVGHRMTYHRYQYWLWWECGYENDRHQESSA
jgi:hypothetical protein